MDEDVPEFLTFIQNQ